MTTRILDLPQQSGSTGFTNNADWRFAWAFAASGAAIDLSGIAFRMQLRSAADETAIALDLSTANGGLVSGGATGVLTTVVAVADVQAIAAAGTPNWGNQAALIAALPKA